MNRSDLTALAAATARVTLITWIMNNPQHPVPATLVRDSMEKDLNFFLDRLLARLDSEISLRDAASAEPLAEPNERDSITARYP